MARDVSTDAGKYNRPIQVQKPVDRVDDGQGGNSASGQWQTIASPFAHLYSSPNGRNAHRLWKYMQLYPEATYWAEFRYRASTPFKADGMTVLHRNRRYQVLGAVNMEEENVMILLPLIEYQSQGTKAA